uniref:CCHC-type domain-containing protein n=1 Tax=Romanomermis culicivorax TaxID=13658 RepID=A0A915JMU0_ROMCU
MCDKAAYIKQQILRDELKSNNLPFIPPKPEPILSLTNNTDKQGLLHKLQQQCFVCKQRGHTSRYCPNQQNPNVQNCIEDRLPQPQMNIDDPAFYPTLPTIHSCPQHTLGTIMPAYHQFKDEEYVLYLAIPNRCNMSPPSPPKTDAIPK